MLHFDKYFYNAKNKPIVSDTLSILRKLRNYNNIEQIKTELDQLSDTDLSTELKQIYSGISRMKEEITTREKMEARLDSLFRSIAFVRGESAIQYYQRVISEIAHCIHAAHACLYLVNSSEANAIAGYALDKLPEKINAGEGLIGQALLDKKTLYIDSRQQNFKISSGLGASEACSLLIVPCQTGNMLTAILEFASFHPFTKEDQLLLRQISFSIGAGVEERIHIEKSEEQNRIILMKEQELNQQLQITKKIQSELEAREKVFGHTTILSESDVYGTITFANQKLCDISGYTIDEMLGKGHNLFRHPDMPKQVFKLMWNTLKRGEVFRGIVKNKTKSGSHYWVDATIVPIFNSDGTIQKYIGARYHINNEELAQHLFQEFLVENKDKLDQFTEKESSSS